MQHVSIEGFWLAPQQKHVWQRERGGPPLVSQCLIRICGEAEAEALRNAAELVVERHEILRTRFESLPGMDTPIQVVAERGEPGWREVDLSHQDSRDAWAAVDSLAREEAERPFEAHRASAARFLLAKLSPAERVLVLTAPSLCLDSRALVGFWRELGRCHAASLAAAEPLDEPLQYVQFSEWQNELLAEEDAEQGRDFWRRQLDGASLDLALPFVSAASGGREESRRLAFDADLTGRAEQLASAQGVDLQVLLLGCWGLLLSRLSASEDVVVWTLFDGRKHEELQEALGLFAKYLPLRVRVPEGAVTGRLLGPLAEQMEEAASWQEYFLGREEPAVAGFDFAGRPEGEGAAGLRFELVRHHSQIERFKLRLSCVRQRDGLAAEIFYDAGALEPSAVERLGAQLEQLVRSVVTSPQAAVSELEIIGETERRQVLFDWNETARDYPRGAGLVELFEAAVARTPQAPAVLWGEEVLNFSELDRKANRLAHRLLELGVGREARVGLCLGRGTEAIVGLWGILKAGAAYVPLDPAQPRPRLEGMMRDAGVSVAVTDAQIEGLTCVLVDGSCEAPETSPGVAVDGESLAYVLYTSGSTGRPKGVMVRQGSVVNLARSLRERVYDRAGEGLRVSVNAPLTFDASVKQVIQLLWGHALVIVPEEVRADGESLLAALIDREVQVLDCTPSQLHLLLAAGLESAGIRLERVLVGGEAINPQLWSRLGGIDKIRFFNVYGPTECTVDATAWEVTGERPVLGRAIPNARVYALDPALRPVPVGLAGELCIGGEGVGRGYVGRPELTAERFVPDPFGGEPGARLYRTGDLARWGGDGLLEYLGRVDHQVKVRGVRIELEEIEEVLRSQSGVEEAVVALREDEPGDARLVAYVVPRRSHRAVLDGRVRRELPNGLAVVEQNRNETEYLYEEIFAKRSYAQHGVGLPEGACVFDVGANIGMFTLFVRQQCPTARIYAFEPIAPIYETLRLNAELYAPGAKLFACGLSDTERTEAFTYYPRYSMMSSQRDYSRPSEEVEVVKRFLSNERSAELLEEADELLAGRFEGESHPGRLRRLSQVLREEGVERIDLLKVDVQRAEMDVLRGIDEADWSRIDQVVMEVHDARGEESEGRSREIVSFLESHGFQAVAEQDELLVGTDRYNLYAVREGRRPAVEAAPAQPEAVLSPGAVRDLLKHRLPEIMVPSVVVLLEELPLTRNGKVDRSALPAPEQERDETSGVQEARTPFEEVLAGIWSEVLKAPRVGIEESFFDLGGHSLLATQLISRVREVFRVDLPLRMLFEFPTVAQLALRVEESMRSGTGAELPPIGKAPRDIELPLSFSQQRLWFFDQLTPGSTVYNSPRAVRLAGELDVAALEAVLGELVRRHESLRTSFPVVKGEPVQRIAPAGPYTLAVVDLSGLDDAAREEEAARLAAETSAQPFDLARGPLLRTALLRLNEREHLMLFSLHHIVSDAWSLAVLVREMVALYEAYRERRPSPLSELPIQYADYAWWQRQWLQGEILQEQVDYWRSLLGESPAVLELPADRPRSALRGFRGAHQRLMLGRALSAVLRDLSRREGTTPFMTLLAGYQILLHRYTGLSGISVGSPIAGRRQIETEGLIGLFINTLVLHAEVPGETSFRGLLAKVREASLGAYAHQDLPFEKLVEELAPERDTLHSPLFQVSFTFQNAPVEALEAPGLRVTPYHIEIEAAKLDLSLMLMDDPEAIGGELQYRADLFDATTILRFASHFQTLLAAAVADPGREILELPLWSEAERHQLLAEWNDSTVPQPGPVCLHQIFETHALRDPQAPALSFGGETLSYGEVSRRANRLARYLQTLGVGPEVLVGVAVERSPELAIAFLAVLKAGGAYLPLDPSYPTERLAYMIESSGVLVILTQDHLAEALPPFWGLTIRVDGDEALFAACGDEDLPLSVAPDNLAYVIYTSGSTGRPKGAMLPHRGLRNLAAVQGLLFDVGPGSRVLQFASSSFDASIWDLVMALASGAELRLAPGEELMPGEGLAARLAAWGITHATLPPSALAVLPEGDLPGLSTVIAAGEACPPTLARRWSVKRRFYNGYGPTEATVCTSMAELASERVTLGRPAANAWIALLDHGLAPVPAGAAGELWVSGPLLGRGYLGRPDLTAERFVPHPFAPEPGARMYRTGDLVRRLQDGTLDYLGRIDHQVKLRGFRIELSEIEAVLLDHPRVREAAVLLREDTPGDGRLVAYVAAEGDEAVAPGELRDLLRERLPEYMIPAAVVTLSAFPLTSSGKVDRRALPAPERVQAEVECGASPRTPVEEVLAAIWSELLKRDRMGPDSHFFDLGGHSLLATQVLARVRQAFEVELSMSALFDAPTLGGFAVRVEEAMRAGEGRQVPRLVPVARDMEIPLSFAQQRLWFLDQMEPGSAAYNLPLAYRLTGPLDAAALERSCGEIVRRHEALRTRFVAKEGSPVQVISPAGPPALPRVDLSGLEETARKREARRLTAEEARRPFDLQQGPVLRLALLRLEEQDHAILATLHHIVGDGWSLEVLARELSALYRAFAADLPSPLPDLPVQYADFAWWQRQWLRGEVLDQEIGYWRGFLQGASPVLDLPADRPRPAVRSLRGATRRAALPLSPESLQALGRREGATLFMVLMAGLSALLGRYASQEDVTVGTPVAGRRQLETEGLIGFFVNTLVLRTDLAGDPGFSALLARVRSAALGAYLHQDVPFEKLVDELQPARDLSRTPLFQVMFAVQNVPPASLELPGLRMRGIGAEGETAKFDLSLSVTEAPSGLSATLSYSTDLFDAPTIDRMLGHFAALVAGAAARPEARLSELPSLSAAELHQALAEWNDVPEPLGGHRLGVLDRFRRQAEAHPDAPALLFEGEAWTYRELGRRSDEIGARLRELGVGPEVPVGTCLERSPEVAAAILGIFKAGGAFLPLDPDLPDERLAFLMGDALAGTGAPVLLTADRFAERVLGLAPAGSRAVRLDADREEIAGADPRRLPAGPRPGDLAYLIYTSGTTGTPKAVGVEHRNLASTLAASQERFVWAPGDRTLCLAPFSFDIFLFELLNPLLTGGACVLFPPRPALDLRRLLAALDGVTVLHAVPALMRQIVEAAREEAPEGERYGHVRAVFVGGDAVPAELLSDLREVFPRAAVRVLYGPTEGTIICASHEAADDAVPRALLGRPLPGSRLHLLDRDLRPVPQGAAGEICIAGGGVARGYRGLAELTAERFVPDPFAVAAGDRLYRSGDLARRLVDGRIEFLGRTDQQVKVRGFRIEPGEVEAALLRHPGVREAVAAVHRDGEGARLVAYIVAHREPPPAVHDLRLLLGQILPEHMVPSVFVFLPALPLSAHGKVDRKALPTPELVRPAGLSERFLEPATRAERILAGIWREVLNVEQVGARDSFFELGGDSILSIQVVARARKAGFHLTPRQVFQHPTLAALAREAVEAEGLRAEQGLVTGDVPLTPVQSDFFELELAGPHHFNQSLLLQAWPPPRATLLRGVVEALVAHHDALRLRFRREESGWRQWLAGLDGPHPFAHLDLAPLPEAAQRLAIEAAAEALQASLDLAGGPLLRVAQFDLGPERPARLFIAVHHLAVDGVSWRILLDDLLAAYEQRERSEEVRLPAKTTSFKHWSERLAAYVRSGALEAQRSWWLAEERRLVRPLPVDFPGADASGGTGMVSAMLTQEETRALLQDVPPIYHTQINDVLLAALARSLARFSGDRSVLVELEGHGREEQLFEDVDLSRTMGWFTAVYPVFLRIPPGASEGDLLKSVKEQLRAIPQRGLGHGLLRWLSGDPELVEQLRGLPGAEVVFNYHGQLDRVLPESSLFRMAPESKGSGHAGEAPWERRLAVSGSVVGGRLELVWSYPESLYRRSTIDSLAQDHLEVLRALIAHCRDAGAGEHTPSDFPLAELDQDELRNALEEVDFEELEVG